MVTIYNKSGINIITNSDSRATVYKCYVTIRKDHMNIDKSHSSHFTSHFMDEGSADRTKKILQLELHCKVIIDFTILFL